MANRNDTAFKGFVDRMFEVEKEFNDAKIERNDTIKDLKSEIKSRIEQTGVEVKEVVAQVKIRLDESAARDARDAMVSDLATYDILFGDASTKASDDDDI